MLRKARELHKFRLGARDGEIGRVKDFYFDDQSWIVRYLVADTGTWLAERRVLISPHAITGIHLTPDKVVEVNLSKGQLAQSPSIDADQALSRQFEAQYHAYFEWPVYWEGPWAWGSVPLPGPNLVSPTASPPQATAPSEPGDPHVRSTNDVSGYSIQALDHKFGHIEDFILDDLDWAIRYLVVDTRGWWPEKRVLLPPLWIAWVSWPDSTVYVDLDKETIKRSPAYDPSLEITRDHEAGLFRHYGREPYWPSTSDQAPPA